MSATGGPYTLGEVAAHNKLDDCWLILERDGVQKVYDTTKYNVSSDLVNK
jgi:hypothetical protein